MIIFSGNFSGTGSLSQIGPGTLILSAANTYSGGTVIDRGTLLVNAKHLLAAPCWPRYTSAMIKAEILESLPTSEIQKPGSAWEEATASVLAGLNANE